MDNIIASDFAVGNVFCGLDNFWIESKKIVCCNYFFSSGYSCFDVVIFVATMALFDIHFCTIVCDAGIVAWFETCGGTAKST